jgi:Kef-type K+ transport system membrane component KefB
MDSATTALPLARFILQAAAILLVARAAGLVMRRLGQPQVVAEIIAGILLGPSLLGWVAPDAFDALFAPDSLDVLNVLSQVGLVMFMFLVGVEVDPRFLRGRGRASVVLSYANLVGPFVVAIPLALSIHDDYVGAADTWLFVLFFGTTMAISAFAVLARILTDHGILRTPVGTLAITSAAVGDVFLWCLIAFIVAASRASGLDGAFMTLALSLAFVLAIFFVARPLLVGLSRTATAASGPSHNIVALVLVLVFLASWVTEQIGIHALFGAFAIGVILPRRGGFARVMAERLEGIVVVFFLPLFFAYSGLRTELAVLAGPSEWLLFLVITVVACVGKLGPNALAARLSGMSWREAGALGVIMNTRGLMELVVLNLGLDLGLVSPALFSMLVLMALVTTLMTAPLLRLVYPSNELAKSVIDAAPTRLGPAALPTRYRVMVRIDDHERAPLLARLAHAVSGPAGAIDAVHLMSAEAAEHHFDPPEASAAAPADPLDSFLAAAYALGAEPRPLAFVSRDPAAELARLAALRTPDVLLVASHEDAHGRSPVTLTGSRRGCHVVVSDGPACSGVTEVLTFDDDERDAVALDLARRIAEHTRATLRIVTEAPAPTPALPAAGALWVIAGHRRALASYAAAPRLIVHSGAGDEGRARPPTSGRGVRVCTLAPH